MPTRLEDLAQCILVIIGATLEGKKVLVGFTDGMRERAQSWRELLRDLKRRGAWQRRRNLLSPMARLASGWRVARCGRRHASSAARVHKTANVLNKRLKSLHAKAKRALQETCDGVQADRGHSEKPPSARRTQPVAKPDLRCEVYRRHRSRQAECLRRYRLTPPVTKIRR